MYIQLFPTFRCNESCTFCFNREMSVVPDMETADFHRLIDVLSENGIKELDMLGGEPTLHPDLTEMIEIATKNTFLTSMSTNGTNIPLLEALAQQYDQSILKIGVSLNDTMPDDGLLSFIHSYKPMVKSVCKAGSFLPPHAYRLLDSQDISYYAIYRDALHETDLGESLFFPHYHSLLTAHHAAYAKLEGVYCAGFIPEGNLQLDKVRCPAGSSKLSVTPDGSVYPCYLLFSFQEYRLGNILTDKFSDLLQSPILNWFRTFDGNQCPTQQCALHSSCHGGCPAVSLMLSGSINAPEPRCKLLNVDVSKELL